MLSSSSRKRRVALLLVALLLGGFAAYRRPAAPTGAANPRPIRTAAATAQPAAVPPAGSAAAVTAVVELPLAAGQLLDFVQPANASALTAALRAPAAVVRYVRINPALIEGKESPFWQPGDTGRVVLPLPEGGEATVVIQSSESLGARRFTSLGRIEGRPESRAVFAYNEGFLHAHLEDPDLGEYELRAATESVEQYYKVDPDQLKSCGGGITPLVDADALAEIARRKLAAANQPATTNPDDTTDRSVESASVGANVQIDLLMLYTQAVLPTLTGTQRTAAIQSAFDAAVAQLNGDLARSLAQARVRLVRIAQVTYAGDDLNTTGVNWQSTMLTRLRGTTDGFMDEIHSLRDQSGADLVCLSQWRFDTTSAGIAYTLTIGAFDHATNPLFGFSVVQYDYMTVEHVFSHELGHNLGCTHNREDSSGQGAYSYSYGYRFTATNGRKYRDIMSYDTSPSSYTFVPYFSTPLVTPISSGASLGVPVGIAAGQAGESDCARTIDQVAFEVSSYRLQQQAVATAGTLYAVSTRALVGTSAEQQLIGAFIVSGPTGSTKRMLIRGNGPALSGAVTNFLPNPKLTLYRVDVSPNVVVAENDDWGTNTNATAIATAGGTSAASGSRDAALLVDLPPGTYTANVTSSDGGTGVALVEAYEVSTAGTKVTALSTRGYSSTDQVMIAGFIVNGTTGTTKRIVIRGQGPNLARQGVTGAMDDPYLELYNSTGDRVMVNDDWAVQNVGSSSDDFRPQAVLYSELQIQAAGMAPANRREPCILVDLPPGVYTAILKPYQTSTTTTGSPGVALVEVYEIP
jgi:hypothetical protein